MKEDIPLLIPVVMMWFAAGYICYVFWRDNRLDAEDEKHDRIRGEKHA